MHTAQRVKITQDYSRSILTNVNDWAATNNLSLSIKKTQEIIIYKSKHTMKNAPAVIPEITRFKHLNILGVTVDEMLTFSEHVSVKVSQAHQQLYALKALKAHGLSGTALHNVCNAVFLPTITYASQAWWGFVSAADQQKLSSLYIKLHDGIWTEVCHFLNLTQNVCS